MGSDTLLGGDGDDRILYEAGDASRDGGNDIDSLIIDGATILLSGVSMMNIEKIDMTDANNPGDGTIADIVSFGLSDLLNWDGGDNSLDALLISPTGNQSFIVTGDSLDTLLLDGMTTAALDVLSLTNGWTAPDTTPMAYFSGDSDNYLKLSHSGIDLYVHEDMLTLI